MMKVEIEVTDEMYDDIFKEEMQTLMKYCEDEKILLAAKILWDYYGFE